MMGADTLGVLPGPLVVSGHPFASFCVLGVYWPHLQLASEAAFGPLELLSAMHRDRQEPRNLSLPRQPFAWLPHLK